MVIFVDNVENEEEQDFEEQNNVIFVEDDQKPEGDGLVEAIRFIINKRVVIIPTLFIDNTNVNYLKELDGEQGDVVVDEDWICVDKREYGINEPSHEWHENQGSKRVHIYNNVTLHLVRVKLFSKYKGGIVS